MKLKALLLSVLLVAEFAAADAHLDEAIKLLESSGSRKAMETMSDMMLAQQLQQNPTLQPFEHVMRKFFDKHISYDTLEAEFAALYTAAFSYEELKEINAFYASPVGQKTVQLMPGMMQEAAELCSTKVQENIGELQAMVAAEAERLTKLQEAERAKQATPAAGSN